MLQHDSIPSRALEIWRRLYTRFSLEPGPASIGPDVSKTILPITDVSELLRRPRVATGTADLSPAAGTYVPVHTVPAGARWTITAYFVGGSTTAASIQVSVNGTNVTIRAGSAAEDRQGEWVLDENDSIGLVTNADAGDTAILLDIHFREEDSF